VDTYGVGTSVVTGSGAPTASMVYKLVEVDGMPVEKRSLNKASHGGRKQAARLAKRTGTIVEEVVHPVDAKPSAPPDLVERPVTVPLVQQGELVDGSLSLEAARERVREGLHSLPWDGLKLSRGEPAIPTRMIAPASP
jgi:nicotinate phosphoribosyltransferase